MKTHEEVQSIIDLKNTIIKNQIRYCREKIDSGINIEMYKQLLSDYKKKNG